MPPNILKIYKDTIAKVVSMEGFSTAVSLQFPNVELLSLILWLRILDTGIKFF